jgi:uncharacterized LabA/DUF88 family protein
MTYKSGKPTRVRVFIDYWNFARNWRDIYEYTPDKNLDWAAFPNAILDALDEVPLIRHTRKELRAVKVYTSLQPPRDLEFYSLEEKERLGEEHRLKEWFQNDLDQLTAYTVDITPRADDPLRCEVCKCENSHFVEQGVDTKIAIDLVALASSDLYDIAVLVTDDSDLVPSVQCVQDSLDKQVVHVGFRKQKTEVRTEAWGHLFFEQMFADIVKS